MNKNRKIKRSLTTSLAVGMSVMMGAVPVYAAGSTDTQDVYKEETVYVNADATGNSDEVTVSDWLKNSGSVSGNLTDESILKEIKNVKGDETFTENGDQLTWNTAGEDIPGQLISILRKWRSTDLEYCGRRYLLSGYDR